MLLNPYRFAASVPELTSGTFSYPENSDTSTVLGTASATGGATAFRFASTGTSISSDGLFTISSAGVIKLTGAGVAAIVNDYEQATATSSTEVLNDSLIGAAGALLTAHTADSGHTWASPVANYAFASDGLNGLRGTNSSTATAFANSSAVFQANGFVECTFDKQSTSNASFWRVSIGAFDDVTGAASVRAAVFFNGSTNLMMYRADGSSETLATFAGSPSSLPFSNTLRFEANKVILNGVEYAVSDTLPVGQRVAFQMYAGAPTQADRPRFKSIKSGHVTVGSASKVHAVEAGNASNNWSDPVNMTLTVTDVDDAPLELTTATGTLTTTNWMQAVAGNQGVMIAFPYERAPDQMGRSTDGGLTWTRTAAPGTAFSYADAIGTADGFVVLWYEGCEVSHDLGQTWSTKALTGGEVGNSYNQLSKTSTGAIVALNDFSPGYISVSANNGDTWARRDIPGFGSNTNFDLLGRVGTKFIVSRMDTANIYTTIDDGVNWTLSTLPITGRFGASASSGTRLCAVSLNSGSNPNKALVTTDGITWTQSATLPLTVGVSATMAWVGDRFVLTNCGSGTQVLESFNGLTWTEVTLTPALNLSSRRIAWDGTHVAIFEGSSGANDVSTTAVA